MATNHTTNYELSQWRSDDQVLRADFNADNAKLDAALANLAQELDLRAKTHTVLRQVMGEGESGVSFSAQVGEVDWTVWRCVHLVFTPVHSTPLAYEMTVSCGKGSVSSETLSGPLHAAFWPLGSGEQNTHGLYWGSKTGILTHSHPPKDLESITFKSLNSSYLFQAGTTLLLLGERF